MHGNAGSRGEAQTGGGAGCKRTEPCVICTLKLRDAVGMGMIGLCGRLSFCRPHTGKSCAREIQGGGGGGLVAAAESRTIAIVWIGTLQNRSMGHSTEPLAFSLMQPLA